MARDRDSRPPHGLDPVGRTIGGSTCFLADLPTHPGEASAGETPDGQVALVASAVDRRRATPSPRLPELEKRAFRPAVTGVLLLDAALRPIYLNSEATQILAYPETTPEIRSLESFLRKRVRSVLLERGSPRRFSFLPECVSGRRRYLCRTFSLGSPSSASLPGAAIAVLLERKQQRSFDGSQIAAIVAQFRLTPREQETLELLVQGFTSKEIAYRMRISPNTVKAFVRLIMVKMGATTRAGLVGRILESKLLELCA